MRKDHEEIYSDRFKLVLSYDGTAYSGWQVQENATSIQTLVQTALSTILREPTQVAASGRTDAGVHALAQVAHFSTDDAIDPERLLISLNGLLPPDIRAMELTPAAPDFHARYDAKGKIYRYHLHLSEIRNPFKLLYSVHITYPLDLPLLKAAAQKFIGTHDFTSFSNEAHRGSAARDPVRTITRLDVIEEEGGIYLEFEGDGFLYKMVRNIVGTLIDVARGKLALEQIDAIFDAKDRKKASPTAPAHGLFLVRVIY